MTPRDPEEMRQLGALCDQILEAWDKQSGELDAALARYGDLLRRSLEPAQLEVLDGLAQLEHRG